MTSWKTTMAGVAGILLTLGAALKAISDGNYDAAIGAAPVLVVAIGHLFARDNNVTSEQAGAKK